MIFNRHSSLLEGRHAFLSASKYSWINYDDEKLDRVYGMSLAAQRGTELHKLAHDLIRLGVRLPDNPPSTMALYVNDGIGYRMTPEQLLYYSDNCFGTADTVCFRNNCLRIHDLKTGLTPVKIHQHEIYAALFCLEYKYRPFEIEIELRIYQNNEVQVYEADPDVIFHIMDKIVTFDKRINSMRQEAQL